MERRGGDPCEGLWIGIPRKLGRRFRQTDASLERVVDIVEAGPAKLLAHERIGDCLRRRGADDEAAARPLVAGEIDREREFVDPPQRLAQRAGPRPARS